MERGRASALHLAALLATCAVAGVAYGQDIRATVDGNNVDFPDVQPLMLNYHVMVPVRGVFEYMHARVRWNDNTQTVVAQRGNDIIQLPVNSRYATVNGRRVVLDAPAMLYSGRTMVPLRFVSETLGASVRWVESTQTVEIDTNQAYHTTEGDRSERVRPPSNMVRMQAGTVIPFRLNQRLSSNESSAGDRFEASPDTSNRPNYQGLSSDAVLEGHVDVVRARNRNTPGVLGLAFDRIRMPSGQTYKVYGVLIGLDSKSVDSKNGRWVARSNAKNDNLKFLGYGAGGGALVAILTKNNVLTSSLIGGAAGYLFGTTQKNPSAYRDVNNAQGTRFGLRLTRDFSFRTPNAN
jgi:hypothetical protein